MEQGEIDQRVTVGEGRVQMDTIVQLAEAIELSVFSGEWEDLQGHVAMLSLELEKVLPVLNAKEIQSLNQILEYVMVALSNRDYLLLADLMRYELIPLSNRTLQSERRH